MVNVLAQYYTAGRQHLKKIITDENGVTAIEYALIGVAMATLLAFILGDQDSGFLGTIREAFDNIAEAIKNVTTAK